MAELRMSPSGLRSDLTPNESVQLFFVLFFNSSDGIWLVSRQRETERENQECGQTSSQNSNPAGANQGQESTANTGKKNFCTIYKV